MTPKGSICHLCGTVVLVAIAALVNGCRVPGALPDRALGFHSEESVVDGRLDESRYRSHPFAMDFKPACRSGVMVPETKTWLWWNESGLWFAFAAKDDRIVAAPPTEDEHAVDRQDRVEVFLWPEGSESYFCVEIAPGGAVHDYSARIYRRFNDAWRPEGGQFAARQTAGGYVVEGFLPASALRAMGFATWKPGTHFQLGLFRADFDPDDPGNPLWLTWIDPQLPQADFHVCGAFARVTLRR